MQGRDNVVLQNLQRSFQREGGGRADFQGDHPLTVLMADFDGAGCEYDVCKGRNRHDPTVRRDIREGADVLRSGSLGKGGLALQHQIDAFRPDRNLINPHAVVERIQRQAQRARVDASVRQSHTIRLHAKLWRSQFQPRSRAELIAFSARQGLSHFACRALGDAEDFLKVSAGDVHLDDTAAPDATAKKGPLVDEAEGAGFSEDRA